MEFMGGRMRKQTSKQTSEGQNEEADKQERSREEAVAVVRQA